MGVTPVVSSHAAQINLLLIHEGCDFDLKETNAGPPWEQHLHHSVLDVGSLFAHYGLFTKSNC